MRDSSTEQVGQASAEAEREKDLAGAFVSLVTAMVDGVDPLDLLSGLTQDCVRLLDVASSGLLLADQHGVLHLLAASSEATRALELYQLQRQQGPCLDCYRTGARVSEADLTSAPQRWPQFSDAAARAGLVSVHAFPVRLHDRVLGALGLFGTSRGSLNDAVAERAQALAYVAAVALVQDQAAADTALLARRLQTALDSRAVLEQAKGIIAQHANLDMDQALSVLRRFCRDRNYRLTQVAEQVAKREISPQQLIDHSE